MTTYRTGRRWSDMARGPSFLVCLFAYLTAGAAAWYSTTFCTGWHPIAIAATADLVGTLVIFAWSLFWSNSSFYDAYWSVAPIAIACYWAFGIPTPGVPLERKILVLGLVSLWGVRLTYNWARGWPGMNHEDWRYLNIQRDTGRAYWLVSLTGIHIFPTAQVFLGCLALYPALAVGKQPLGWIDAVATAVTLIGIAWEAIADQQLRNFVKNPNRKEEDVLTTGLWAFSRHPNYFGEMTFWWGLYLFVFATLPSFQGWALIGPASITAMFIWISLPMIDKRMLRKRPHYQKRIESTSAVIPWFPSRS